jgi:four helix bundle protein
MATHKTLAAWQEAHAVVNLAMDFAKLHWRPYLAPVFDQLTRAALSAQINISEGYGFGSRPRFVHHLRIAKGSASETGDLLELLVERSEIPQQDGQEAVRRCRKCHGLLFGLIRRYAGEARL